MRRTGIVTAVAGVFAVQAVCMAHSETHGVSLAAIETESVAPEMKGEAPGDARSPEAQVSPSGNPLWAIPISKLSATRDRPVFSASRRPRTPTVAAAPEPSPVAAPVVAETPPFALVGTIIGEDSRIAIFFDETSKTATGMKEGERASGWTLQTVKPRSTILEGNGRRVTLDLPEPAGQESPAPLVSEAPLKPKPRRENPGGL
jgi:hypothetical protein